MESALSYWVDMVGLPTDEQRAVMRAPRQCRRLQDLTSITRFLLLQHLSTISLDSSYGTEYSQASQTAFEPQWPPPSIPTPRFTPPAHITKDDAKEHIKDQMQPYLRLLCLNEDALHDSEIEMEIERITGSYEEKKPRGRDLKSGNFLYANTLDASRELQVQCLLNRAHVALQKDRYSRALRLGKEALAIAELLNYEPLSARCWYWIARAKHAQGKRSSAVRDMLRALPCAGHYIESDSMVEVVNSLREEILRIKLRLEQADDTEYEHWSEWLDSQIKRDISYDSQKLALRDDYLSPLLSPIAEVSQAKRISRPDSTTTAAPVLPSMSALRHARQSSQAILQTRPVSASLRALMQADAGTQTSPTSKPNIVTDPAKPLPLKLDTELPSRRWSQRVKTQSIGFRDQIHPKELQRRKVSDHKDRTESSPLRPRSGPSAVSGSPLYDRSVLDFTPGSRKNSGTSPRRWELRRRRSTFTKPAGTVDFNYSPRPSSQGTPQHRSPGTSLRWEGKFHSLPCPSRDTVRDQETKSQPSSRPSSSHSTESTQSEQTSRSSYFDPLTPQSATHPIHQPSAPFSGDSSKWPSLHATPSNSAPGSRPSSKDSYRSFSPPQDTTSYSSRPLLPPPPTLPRRSSLRRPQTRRQSTRQDLNERLSQKIAATDAQEKEITRRSRIERGLPVDLTNINIDSSRPENSDGKGRRMSRYSSGVRMVGLEMSSMNMNMERISGGMDGGGEGVGRRMSTMRGSEGREGLIRSKSESIRRARREAEEALTGETGKEG